MFLILLSAPGFVAACTARILGVTSPRKGEFDSLAAYLSYSFFAVFFTIAFSYAVGLIDLNDTWQVFIQKFSTIKFSICLMLIALISSLFVGIAWALFFNCAFVKILNRINALFGANLRNVNGSLFNRLFDDGKEHFVIVRKNNNDIAAGFIFSASDPFDSKVELSLTEYPEYRKELEKIRTTDEPSPLRNTIQVYVDVENDMVITETEYPAEWL